MNCIHMVSRRSCHICNARSSSSASSSTPPTEVIWSCKIGGPGIVANGGDFPMRQAIRRAFREVAGRDDVFCFSGWGASINESERAVVENRLPAAESPIPESPGSHAMVCADCLSTEGPFTQSLVVGAPGRITCFDAYGCKRRRDEKVAKSNLLALPEVAQPTNVKFAALYQWVISDPRELPQAVCADVERLLAEQCTEREAASSRIALSEKDSPSGTGTET